MTGMVKRGRVWKFGANINSDLLYPNVAFRVPEEEQHRFVFHANRPGWVEEVRDGDLLVAGANFGLGSGRGFGRLLLRLGIAGVVAESFNGLGFRNCIGYALPAMTLATISDGVEEGDEIEVDFLQGTVSNLTTGWTSTSGSRIPPFLQDIISAGGTIALLRSEGLIHMVDPIPVKERAVALRSSRDSAKGQSSSA